MSIATHSHLPAPGLIHIMRGGNNPDTGGKWLRNALFFRGRRVWTSEDPNVRAPLLDTFVTGAEEESARQASLLERDRPAPLFAGLTPLSVHNGFSFRTSYQQVNRDEQKSRAHHMILAASHRLPFKPLEDFSIFSSVAMTAVEFGNQDVDPLNGKTTAELGVKWDWLPRHLLVYGGLSAALMGDTLDGYRSDVASHQLALDSSTSLLPNSTALRGRVSYFGRHRSLHYIANLGGDLLLSRDGGAVTSGDDVATFLRGAGSVAYSTQRFSYSTQLRFLSSLDNTLVRNRSIVNASLTIEASALPVTPSVSFHLPLLGSQNGPGATLGLSYRME